jgi:hypothetical protein
MPTSIAAALATLVLGLTVHADARALRPGEPARPRPLLQLRTVAPLEVVGQGFGSGEVVRLVVVTERLVRARTAISSAKGRLTMRFDLSVKRCSELTVHAAGSLGSRAVLRRSSSCERGRPPK